MRQDLGKKNIFIQYNMFNYFIFVTIQIIFSESDFELEGLIPEVSEVNIKLLSIEPDPVPSLDDKQIYGKYMYELLHS